VVEPEVLLMDEAFSALDVLTGERLREDILELWDKRQIPTKAMLVVSHNIEEAVMMADRILIFASDPGRIRCQMAINLPRPRDVDSVAVRSLIDEVYALMTAGRVRGVGRVTGEAERARLYERLPQADIGRMEGLLELLQDDPFIGRADLPKLAEESGLTDEDLLPITNALSLLDLATVEHGDITTTMLGQRYVRAENAERRAIFAQQLLARVPLAAHIRHSLEQEASGELSEKLFLKLLREGLDEDEAERVLQVAIEWGRYGEVYDYNYTNGLIHLPKDEEEAHA
jgi:NitT/TauT family transport system ATP-binding protein